MAQGKETPDILVNDGIPVSEIGLLLICSVRYGLGRMSYVVSEICDVVRSRFTTSDLSDLVLDVLISDIFDAISAAESSGKWVGMRMDHEQWVSLLDFLRTERTRRVTAHGRTGSDV